MLRNGLQPSHIIVLVLVIVLIFGATKLPDIARSIGQSLKIFKKEVRELRDDTDISDSGATSSYTATGGQPPQQNPTYPDAQQSPPGTGTGQSQSGAPGAAEHPSASTPPKS